MIEPARTALFGSRIWVPSSPRSRVVRESMSTTIPRVPSISMVSSIENGRLDWRITEATKFSTGLCSASASTRPPRPSAPMSGPTLNTERGQRIEEPDEEHRVPGEPSRDDRRESVADSVRDQATQHARHDGCEHERTEQDGGGAQPVCTGQCTGVQYVGRGFVGCQDHDEMTIPGRGPTDRRLLWSGPRSGAAALRRAVRCPPGDREVMASFMRFPWREVAHERRLEH